MGEHSPQNINSGWKLAPLSGMAAIGPVVCISGGGGVLRGSGRDGATPLGALIPVSDVRASVIALLEAKKLLMSRRPGPAENALRNPTKAKEQKIAIFFLTMRMFHVRQLDYFSILQKDRYDSLHRRLFFSSAKMSSAIIHACHMSTSSDQANAF